MKSNPRRKQKLKLIKTRRMKVLSSAAQLIFCFWVCILNQTITGTSKIKSGRHILKIFMINARVILDKIVLSAGGIKPSYFAPPETAIR